MKTSEMIAMLEKNPALKFERALALACEKLPAIPDEYGRLEDMFLWRAEREV